MPSADVAMNVERAFWESIDKTRRDELAEYLERYPKGLFASLAQRRLTALEARDARPGAVAEAAASTAVASDVPTGPAGDLGQRGWRAGVAPRRRASRRVGRRRHPRR